MENAASPMNETAPDELVADKRKRGHHEPEGINEVRFHPRRFGVIAEEHEIIDVMHDGGRHIGEEEPPKCAR